VRVASRMPSVDTFSGFGRVRLAADRTVVAHHAERAPHESGRAPAFRRAGSA
jgi:hypothetical protein